MNWSAWPRMDLSNTILVWVSARWCSTVDSPSNTNPAASTCFLTMAGSMRCSVGIAHVRTGLGRVIDDHEQATRAKRIAISSKREIVKGFRQRGKLERATAGVLCPPRPNRSRAVEPLLALVTAAWAARGELAADAGALVVDRAAKSVAVDGDTPAIITFGEGFHAVRVAVDQPVGNVVVGHQYDGETTANCLATIATDGRVHALGVGIGGSVHKAV